MREKLSLVVPVYFEEECVIQFIKETTSTLAQLDVDWEIIFIDDGSEDRTVSITMGNKPQLVPE